MSELPADRRCILKGPTNIAGGYSSGGSITGVIVYLQNGRCGANGENCLIRLYLRVPRFSLSCVLTAASAFIVEATLNGGFSSVDISRIPPHAYNSPLSFAYNDGKPGRAVSIFHARLHTWF